MTPATRLRLRRGCLFLAIGLAIWVGVAYYTGGFVIRVGSIRLLSARSLRNPAILAFLFAAIWWWLAPRGAIGAAFNADVSSAGRSVAAAAQRAGSGPLAWLMRTAARAVTAAARVGGRLAPSLPLWIAIAATSAAVATASLEGVFVVGGADSYGYVSEAHRWAEGRLRVEEPMIATLRDLAPLDASMPLGYRPAPDGTSSVPTYSPGLPMLMAVFQWVGGRNAVFAVVPATAGLLVWATFLLGRRVAEPAVGAAAAVLIATSPTVLLHIVSPPMSDVPTAAWWTLSLALMATGSAAGAAGAGLAAGAAVLTRPNLAPLAAIPLLVIAWPLVTDRHLNRSLFTRLAGYCVPVAAVAALVGSINWALYGSPLLSGYGSLGQYYDWSNWRHNLDRYTRWLLDTQTPWIALALAAPFALRRQASVVVALFAFVAALLLSYLYYLRFEAWIYLRFLLPAFPILLVSLSAVILAATRRLPRGWSAAAFAVAIALLAFDGYSQAQARGVFFTDGERKYALIGRYVGQRLPANAAVLTMQHGGNVRYYSGRAIVRWDYVDPMKLDAVLIRLRATGYEPYLLLESWETELFRQRFERHHVLEALDRPPIARLPLGDIRLYSLAGAGEAPLATEIIPDPLTPDPNP
jgi:hypothetical protein